MRKAGVKKPIVGIVQGQVPEGEGVIARSPEYSNVNQEREDMEEVIQHLWLG